MQQRLLQALQHYSRFMRGRYGRIDELSKSFLVLLLFILIVKRWIPYYIGDLLAMSLLGIILYRFLSKRIYPRSNENQKFVTLLRQRKDTHYRYFRCPACHQQLRAPKGRGKIKITCQKCGKQFIKKV